ncbi:Thioredoxin-related transmembrane protein 1 [Takifugu flavidus]|uniref:Thioredoxin-related transmembrane protein 1 n=1 Tax=Takifugu flavidus TaxID=433684 RepID=A0A5C6NWA6_9TELE|nr:Thioredoxin-related transmembrane protein 1 [Takifugu flavidus]
MAGLSLSSPSGFRMFSLTAQESHRFWRCFVVAALCLSPLSVSAKRESLKEVTDDNWEEILTGEWMIEFYAPWCPACQQLQPVWKDFADWGEDMGVNIAKVDVTEQPGLSGRFVITSLPTIYHCKEGVFRKYQGARTKEEFLSFVDEKKWEAVEPVSSWFGPSSLLMNSMSALFKLSMFIRRCHNYMTEQLGLPVWGSYVIFGLATLLSGLALGLLLVFIADYVFPSRRFSASDYHQSEFPTSRYDLKKQYSQQARLLQQEDELEADGEEDDDEDDEQDDSWSRRRGAPEGRPEPKGQNLSDEALRRRVVGTREEDEDDEEDA